MKISDFTTFKNIRSFTSQVASQNFDNSGNQEETGSDPQFTPFRSIKGEERKLPDYLHSLRSDVYNDKKSIAELLIQSCIQKHGILPQTQMAQTQSLGSPLTLAAQTPIPVDLTLK